MKTFRNIVLLVALASFVSFVKYATWFYANAKVAWQSPRTFHLLTALVQAMFFCVLYGEASEWIKAKARAITAIVLSLLLVLDGAGSTLNLVMDILGGSDHLRVLVNEVFRLFWVSCWIAFLIAFCSTRTATGRLTPIVAGVLALFHLASAVLVSLMLHDAQLTLVSWNHASFLFWQVAMLLYFAAIWKRWTRDLPIHENVVC